MEINGQVFPFSFPVNCTVLPPPPPLPISPNSLSNLFCQYQTPAPATIIWIVPVVDVSHHPCLNLTPTMSTMSLDLKGPCTSTFPLSNFASSGSKIHTCNQDNRFYGVRRQKRIRSGQVKDLSLESTEAIHPGQSKFRVRKWRNDEMQTLYDCSCGQRRPTHDRRSIVNHIIKLHCQSVKV
jgi:hypothetical protein